MDDRRSGTLLALAAAAALGLGALAGEPQEGPPRSVREEVARLVPTLGDPVYEVREEAGRAIEALGRRSPLAALAAIPALHGDPEIAARCLQLREALAPLLTEEVLKRETDPGLLMESIPILPEEMRYFALSRVEAMGGKDAAEALTRSLSTLQDPELLNRAVRAVVRAQGRGSLSHVLPLLKHSSRLVQRYAAQVLGDLKDPSAARHVAGLLGSEDPEVRCAALMALGSIGDPGPADEAARLLKDPEGNVRAFCVSALRGMKARSHLKGVKALLSDPEEGVRAHAAGAVGGLGSRADAKDLLPLLEDRSAYVRSCASGSLGFLGEERTVSRIAMPEPAFRDGL